MKNDKFEFFVMVFVVVFIIVMKGSNSEGQANVLSSFFTKYAEETAAAVIQPVQSNLAEINSVYAASVGQGGGHGLELATVQDNSVSSYSSVLENLVGDFIGRDGNEINTHTVQEGDVLSFIASDYGVSVNTIIWANNLKNSESISIGQELKIPPVTGVIHKVKSGDTVVSIAKKYGVETDTIISFNNLPKVEALQIGEDLIVPDGKPPVQVTTSKTVVQVGIAKRFAQLPSLDGYFGAPTIVKVNLGRVHGRNGVDLDNSCGTPIYAAAEGTITTAKPNGYNGGFGKFIRIAHTNGTETLYAHMSQLGVGVGQSVSRGTQIGLMGTTGRSTGCHLHYEVHGAKNPYARR